MTDVIEEWKRYGRTELIETGSPAFGIRCGDALCAALEQSRARERKLVEALRPLAEAAEAMDIMPDNFEMRVYGSPVTIKKSDCEKARAAIAAARGGEK